MELENIGQLNLENDKKKEFLNSTFWKAIDNGIDIGLRYALPDLIEDDVIELKDNLINYGLKDGIKKSIDGIIETGKGALGIITGNFENMSQIQGTIKNGSTLDKVSEVLDMVIKKVEDSGKISRTISSTLKKEKNSILSSVENNIESTLKEQITGAKQVEEYINNWNKYYENQDFEGMQKEYIKIEKQMNKLFPIENTINSTRYVENIHNLIKNNGHNFNLTKEEIELASKL